MTKEKKTAFCILSKTAIGLLIENGHSHVFDLINIRDMICDKEDCYEKAAYLAGPDHKKHYCFSCAVNYVLDKS